MAIEKKSSQCQSVAWPTAWHCCWPSCSWHCTGQCFQVQGGLWQWQQSSCLDSLQHGAWSAEALGNGSRVRVLTSHPKLSNFPVCLSSVFRVTTWLFLTVESIFRVVWGVGFVVLILFCLKLWGSLGKSQPVFLTLPFQTLPSPRSS